MLAPAEAVAGVDETPGPAVLVGAGGVVRADGAPVPGGVVWAHGAPVPGGVAGPGPGPLAGL
jgi:hypothetical protein